MEALAQGAHMKGINFPEVITCPHEVSGVLATQPSAAIWHLVPV